MAERINRPIQIYSQRMDLEVIESLGPEYQEIYNNQIIPAATRLPIKHKRMKLRYSGRDATRKTTVAGQTVAKFFDDSEVQAAEYREGVEYQLYYYEFGSLRNWAEDLGWDVGERGGVYNRLQYANQSEFQTDVEIITKEFSQTPALDVHEDGLEMGVKTTDGIFEGAVRGSYVMAEREAQTDPNSFTFFLKAPRWFRESVFRQRNIIRSARIGRKKAALLRLGIVDDSDESMIESTYARDGNEIRVEIQNQDLQDSMLVWLKETGQLHLLKECDPDVPIYEDEELSKGYYNWYKSRLTGLGLVRAKAPEQLSGPDNFQKYADIHCLILDMVPIQGRQIHMHKRKLLERDVAVVLPELARQTGNRVLVAALKSLEKKSISTP